MRKNNSLITAIIFLSMCFVSCATANAGSSNGNSSKANTSPQIVSVNPTVTYAGSTRVSLSVSGSNFNGKSIITWNGNARPTTVTSSGLLSVTLSDTDVASPTTAQVQVVNSNSGSKSNTVPVTVAQPGPLAITTNALPAGTQGTAYSGSLSATGGTTPYKWSYSGTLPTGISLSTSGVLSGTPSVADSTTATFAVTDSLGFKAAVTLSISIGVNNTNNLSPLTISTTFLPGGDTGATYSASLNATGGSQPYSWRLASGNLPAGLTLNAAGQISGIPTTAGASAATFQVTDSTNTTSSAALTISVQAPGALDQYGGRTDKPCASATGWFHTEKLGSQWWFCTPAGNGFFMQAMYVFELSNDVGLNGKTYYQIATTKYGDPGPTWAEANLKRLSAWGFNALGPYASAYAVPTFTDASYPLDANGLHSHPTKMPFIAMARPSLYAMTNTFGYLSEPVKSMMNGASPYYTGYKPGQGIADYYDTKLVGWLNADFNNTNYQSQWNQIRNSPYQNYMLGINVDDGDQMFGFGAGDDFQTNSPGHNNPHLGWIMATMSPIQTANSVKGFVYNDSTVFTKKAFRDLIASKYSTVSALNSAWGSNYTTLDSSGIATTESIATGDGSSKSFNYTLKHLLPSRNSIQIKVGSAVVAGDTGDGCLYGKSLNSGTKNTYPYAVCDGGSRIDYSTGTVILSFASAPASSAPISISFVQNGWGIGTGLMDEDGRPSHSWMGSDFMSLTNTNANTRADLNDLLETVADHYFSGMRAGVKAVFPNTLYLGPDSLSTWSVPSRREVLTAAGKSLDVMVTGGMSAFDQNMIDFTATYFGDKPYFEGEFRVANADSAMNAYQNNAVAADVGTFATQQNRGQAYYNVIVNLQQHSASVSGSHPYIGFLWWQYVDNISEKLNWGLVTPYDNAYDGHEATSGSVTCSAPISKYVCGGETKTYGDVITGVTAANKIWLTN
jgi:hypothetical protein